MTGRRSLADGFSSKNETTELSEPETEANRSNFEQQYWSPTSSERIFCKIKHAIDLGHSEPDSITRKQSGMMSVLRRKLTTSLSSPRTSDAITPSEARRRASNGRVLLTVLSRG
eukprot:Amastigsp_a339926_110.p3 type:complete len:114 gc:universal Amastigsp_a339926_110:253-594(+)